MCKYNFAYKLSFSNINYCFFFSNFNKSFNYFSSSANVLILHKYNKFFNKFCKLKVNNIGI